MALTIPVAEIVSKTKNPLLWKHKSWKRVLLGEIATVLNGYAFKSAKFSRGKGTPLIRIRDVCKDSTNTNYEGEFDEKYIVDKGDLLIGMDGDFHSGRWRGPKGLLNQRVCKVVLETEDFLISFLEYLLPGYLKAINDVTSSVTVKHLSSQTIKEIPLPFPSVVEQKRIVAEIEKQFSRLDEAVDNLKRIKANLKRYKASVLKAAVEGKLTKEWRKANPDVEPAGKLLKRILVERRKKWEAAELAKIKAKGKEPKDDRWKKKYKEADSLSAGWVHELPENWCLSNVAQLASQKQNSVSSGPFGSNLGTKDYVESGIPVIRGKNIQAGQILLKDFVYITEKKAEEIKRSIACPGDVVIIAVGSSGRPGIIPTELDRVILSQNCNKVTCDISIILPEFLNLCLQTDFMQEQISGKTTDTVRKFFSLTNFKQIVVPLPPIQEQREILEITDVQISNIDRLEAQVDVNRKRSDRLRQSILKKAFSGKLVPQVNEDESPANSQKQTA